MAATKVNTRFVVILCAVLVMVFGGVAGVFLFVKLRSGDRNAGLGQAAFDKGDFDAAATFFSKAVNKDQSRVDWIEKWRDSIAGKVPATPTAYLDNYRTYLSVLRTLAVAKRTDPAAHAAFLDELYQQSTFYSDSESMLRQIVLETESALKSFGDTPPASVRRFRGIAVVALANAAKEVAPEQMTLARQDLEAAVGANPKDEAAATALTEWHQVAMIKAKEAGSAEEAKAAHAAATKVLDALQTADPGSVSAPMSRLLLDAILSEPKADPLKPRAEQLRARDAVLEQFKPRVIEIGELLLKADPARLTLPTMMRFMTLAIGVERAEGARRALAVVDRACQSAPDNADFMSIRSQLQVELGQLNEAMAGYQKIVELSNKRVSWAGMRLIDLRTRALFQQTLAALRAVVVAKEGERDGAMADVEKYRAALALAVTADSPEMLLVEGKTRFLKGDLRGAQLKLMEFMRTPGNAADQVPEALIYLSDIAFKNRELGLAREFLDRLVALRPGDPRALLQLSSVQMEMQDTAAAVRTLKTLLDIDPDNAEAAKNLQVLQAVQNPDQPVASDPALQVLVEAERILRGTESKLGDAAAATAFIQSKFDANNRDPRLAVALARLHAEANDGPSAIKVLESSLERHPQNEGIAQLLTQMKATSSLEGTLALIRSTQMTPAERAWQEFRVYAAHGKTAESDAALDEAYRLAPQEGRILDAVFVRAIGRKDMATAQTVCDKAVETNADSAEGDSFKARLLLANGKTREAADLLERAAGRGNASQMLLRSLGVVQMQLGRGAASVATLKQAMDLNPSDVYTLRMYIEALDMTQRRQDALAVARQAQGVAGRDPEFLNLWLSLEAATGNTAFAVKHREQLLERDPTNLSNGAALATLYMDTREWAKARALLDKLHAGNEANIGLAMQNARWHADQGNIDASRQVFVALIEAVSAKQSPLPPDPYIAFGRFMYDHGRANWGIAALRQAEQLQDPKTMTVSMLLGDMLLTRGDWAEAEKTFAKVLAAAPAGQELPVRKRLIECLLQQNRLADAEKEFAALGAAAEDDVEIMAQQSHVHHLRGDDRRAREVLDRAVAKFPQEPLPYLRRARLQMTQPGAVRDAIADLDTAIKLKPGMWQALRTRAAVQLRDGQIEAGLRDMQAAADANPGMESLRFDQIDELLRLERDGEAMDVAEAAIRSRPNDARLVLALAARFSAADRWSRAARLHKQLWTLLGDESSAATYVESLLKSKPAGTVEAQEVLNSPKLKVASSPALLLSRAHLARKLNKEDAAKNDAVAAFQLLATNPNAVAGWIGKVRDIFDEPRASLAVLEAVRPPASLQHWVQLQRAVIMSESPAMKTQGVEDLKALTTGAVDRAIKVEAFRQLSMAANVDKNFVDALAWTKAGLDLAPEDVMFNNNAAHYLSVEQGNAKDALPFAERAVALQPRDNRLVDTLAQVHWKLGNQPKALEVIAESLRLATTEADKADRTLTLTEWRLRAGDRKAAAASMNELKELMTDHPRLGTEDRKNRIQAIERDLRDGR